MFTAAPQTGLGGTLERAKDGVYHRLSREHLQCYLDEICFRWNLPHAFPGAQSRQALAMGDQAQAALGSAPQAHAIKHWPSYSADAELRFRDRRQPTGNANLASPAAKVAASND